MYKVILRKFKPHSHEVLKDYTIATNEDYEKALKTGQYYSKLYQKKGLYKLGTGYPSHIVTVIND